MENFDILVVDDSSTDQKLFARALKNLPCTIHALTNGVEATDFMRRRGTYANGPSPRLVFLDLNLPQKSGLEVLKEAKADETLRPIPIVVFSTSSAEKDITNSYLCGANSYVIKPSELAEFSTTVCKTVEYWSQIVRTVKK